MIRTRSEFKPYGRLSPAEKVLAIADDWDMPEESGEPKPGKPEVYPHNNGYFELTYEGVRWFDDAGKPTRICDPLRVEAKSRDPRGRGWGLVFYYRDGDGQEHREVLQMELLHAESNDAVRQLAAGGLAIQSGRSLRAYLLAASAKVRERVRFVHQAGWHGDA